jgi:hypothetical protein
LLPFISFYFLLFPRIGTFQWVAGKENEKIRPPSDLALKLQANFSNNRNFLSGAGQADRIRFI